MRYRQLRTATVLCLTLGLPLPVSAQDDWSLSLSGYAGRNIIENTTVDFDADSIGLQAELEDVVLTSSTSFGGRVTAWRLSDDHVLPEIGFGLDFVAYESELPTQTVQGDGSVGGIPAIFTVALLSPITFTSYGGSVTFQARYPVGASPAFPEGRWYPYMGLGGGAQRTKADWAGDSDWDVGPFVQGFVGVKVFLARHLALFTEYKRTHASHDFNFSEQGAKLDLSFDVNHVVAGLGVHF